MKVSICDRIHQGPTFKTHGPNLTHLFCALRRLAYDDFDEAQAPRSHRAPVRLEQLIQAWPCYQPIPRITHLICACFAPQWPRDDEYATLDPETLSVEITPFDGSHSTLCFCLQSRVTSIQRQPAASTSRRSCSPFAVRSQTVSNTSLSRFLALKLTLVLLLCNRLRAGDVQLRCALCVPDVAQLYVCGDSEPAWIAKEPPQTLTARARFACR